MRLPRDVSADRFVRVLEKLDYKIVRQKGSHIRLEHSGSPTHSITVPCHNPLKVGTPHAILAEIAQMLSIPISAIIEKL